MAEDFASDTGMTARTRPVNAEDIASAKAQEANNFAYLKQKPAPAPKLATNTTGFTAETEASGLAELAATLNRIPKEKQTPAVALSDPNDISHYANAKAMVDEMVRDGRAHEDALKAPRKQATAAPATYVADPARDLADALYVIPSGDLAHFRKLLNSKGGEITPELMHSSLNAAAVLTGKLEHNPALRTQVFHQGRQDPLGALDINNDGKVTNYELAAHTIAFKADADKGAPDSYLAKFAAKFGADKDHNELAGKIYAAMKSQPQMEGVDPKEIHDFGEKAVNVPRPQGAPPAGRGK